MKKDKNLDELFRDKLLNYEQVIPGKSIGLCESDFILIYVLRNEGGHSATSSDILTTRSEELLQRVFFGLFKIIEICC